jgi:hypothetical protein
VSLIILPNVRWFLECLVENQDLTGLATSLLTFLLGVATVWMAIETRRMANTAKDAVVLESRPYFSFQGMKIAPGQLQLPNNQVGVTSPVLGAVLSFKNPGKVMVKYKILNTHFFMDSCGPYEANYRNTGGVIFPGDEIQFYMTALPILGPIDLTTKGILELDFEYWSIEHDKNKLNLKLTIDVNSINPFNCLWFHKEGSPFYS